MININFRLVILLCAAASSLAASPSWFYAGLSAGTANQEPNPAQLWVEVEVNNPGRHSETVELTARRNDGSEILGVKYTVKAGERHVFKIEDPATPADNVAERFSVYARRLDGFRSSLTWGWRQFILQGNQISTGDLTNIPPFKPCRIVVTDLSQPFDKLTITDVAGRPKTVAVCRSSGILLCSSASQYVFVPAFGTSTLTVPPGWGNLLVVQAGTGAAVAYWHFGLGMSTSTFEVNSGITFGKEVDSASPATHQGK